MLYTGTLLPDIGLRSCVISVNLPGRGSLSNYNNVYVNVKCKFI